MNLQQVLENTDEAVVAKTGRGLSEPEKTILEGVWKGMTYEDIAEKSKFSLNYLKRHVGPQLWERLSIAMGEPIKKTNWRKVVLERQGEDAGFEESVFANPKFYEDAANVQPTKPRQDFADAPDDFIFYGRTEELKKLSQWAIDDKCRVLTVLGIGGMGKSALGVKLARELEDEFEFVIWRSLRPGKSLADLLGSIISFFANGYRSQPKIGQVIEYLRRYRCLLVLDGLEAILRSGQLVGCYGSDYQDYAEFLRQLGESSHQSCVLITALEAPREVTQQSRATSPVRLFKLKGLNDSEATKILQDQLEEQDANNDWQDLIDLYLGNPAALKIVAQIVAELFNGNVTEFKQQETLMFEDISRLIAPSFNRISDLEKELLYWLATEQEPVSFSAIGSAIPLAISQGELLEALKSLEARSLIETTTAGGKSLFTLQSLLKEYVITDLLGKIGNSPAKGELPLSQLLRQEESIELTPSQKKPLNLSQWFQYKFDGNWQPIEVFFRAKPNMLGKRLRSTFNLRGSHYVKRFKEIELGSTDDTAMAMLVAIAKEGTQEILIRVQVQSLEEDSKLPGQLALSLFNDTGETIWQKTSSQPMEFIQFPLFKAKLKEKFRIEITLNKVTRIEEFIV